MAAVINWHICVTLLTAGGMSLGLTCAVLDEASGRLYAVRVYPRRCVFTLGDACLP